MNARVPFRESRRLPTCETPNARAEPPARPPRPRCRPRPRPRRRRRRRRPRRRLFLSHPRTSPALFFLSPSSPARPPARARRSSRARARVSASSSRSAGEKRASRGPSATPRARPRTFRALNARASPPNATRRRRARANGPPIEASRCVERTRRTTRRRHNTRHHRRVRAPPSRRVSGPTPTASPSAPAGSPSRFFRRSTCPASCHVEPRATSTEARRSAAARGPRPRGPRRAGMRPRPRGARSPARRRSFSFSFSFSGRTRIGSGPQPRAMLTRRRLGRTSCRTARSRAGGNSARATPWGAARRFRGPPASRRTNARRDATRTAKTRARRDPSRVRSSRPARRRSRSRARERASRPRRSAPRPRPSAPRSCSAALGRLRSTGCQHREKSRYSIRTTTREQV